MASITEDLIEYTLGATAVTALIANRMHELHVPMAGRGPWVYVVLDSSDDLRALDAAVGDEPLQFNLSLECWAGTPREAEDVSGAIRDRINNFSGALSSTRTVQGVFVNSQADDYVPRGQGSDRGLFARSLSATVMM